MRNNHYIKWMGLGSFFPIHKRIPELAIQHLHATPSFKFTRVKSIDINKLNKILIGQKGGSIQNFLFFFNVIF